MSKNDVPSLFISYSHDSEEHKSWVRDLAGELQNKGIHVRLDQWELAFGNDTHLWMEKAVSDSDFVLIICTEEYIQKANDRKDGAGYESTIITPEIQDSLKAKKPKYIPVTRSGDFTLPTYLGSSFAANLKDGSTYDAEFLKIIRQVHGVREFVQPPLGKKPDFSSEANESLHLAEDKGPIKSETSLKSRTREPDIEANRKIEKEAANRWLAAISSYPDNSHQRFPHGHYRYSYIIDDGKKSENLGSVLSKLRMISDASFSGWPFWWVAQNPELYPYVKDGLLECTLGQVKFQDASHSDFWIASKDNEFCILRGYQEDSTKDFPPGTKLDLQLPAYKAAEAILHSLKMSDQNLSGGNKINFSANWSGLNDRELVAWSGQSFLIGGKISKSNRAENSITIYRDEIVSTVEFAKVVQKLTDSLYELFNLHAPSLSFYMSITQQVVGSDIQVAISAPK